MTQKGLGPTLWLRRRAEPCPHATMIVLFWNCQGLAHASTIRPLRVMLRQSDLSCLCISKTKVSNASGILARLGFPNSLEVPTLGLKGGMIFAWRRRVDFDLVLLKQHIISIILFGVLNH